MTLAGDAGLRVREERFVRDRLYEADEIFVTGTAAEVVGVREVDFRTIGSGATGPVTRALRQAYGQAARGGHVRSTEWLTLIADRAAGTSADTDGPM